MVAARKGDGRMVALLLDKGADIDRRNRAGQSALSIAWEHGRELVFRLLLDRGADIHFDAAADRLPAGDRRRGMWRMAEEERLFRPIAEAGAEAPPERFVAYFDKFPDGRRREAVLEFLDEASRKRFAALGDPPDPGKAARFVRDFGALAHGRFEVTASRLNIRAEADANARIAGQYGQGDLVFAREARPGWLRTDRGWISRDHVRPKEVHIPELATRLQAARKAAENRPVRAVSPEPPTPSVPRAKPVVSQAGAKPDAPRTVSPPERSSRPIADSPPGDPIDDPIDDPAGDPIDGRTASRERTVARSSAETSAADPLRVETQFAVLMEKPTLEGLEAFILAYKDREAHADLVRRARHAYREILLREVAP